MKRPLRALSRIAIAASTLAAVGCRSAENDSMPPPAAGYDTTSPGGSYELPAPASVGREPYRVPPADYGADSLVFPPAPLPRTSNHDRNEAESVRKVSGSPAGSSGVRMGTVRHAGPATMSRPAAPRTLPLPGPEWRDIARLEEQSRRSDALPVSRNPVSLGQPEFVDTGESETASGLVSLMNPFGFEPLPPAPAETDRAADRLASRPAPLDPWSLPVFDDGDAEIAD